MEIIDKSVLSYAWDKELDYNQRDRNHTAWKRLYGFRFVLRLIIVY